MDWQDKLIDLYVYICQQYDQKHLWFYTERMSNNDTPTFTDEEVLTISLFGIMQQHTQIKAIYTYTKDHLSDWFPHLPTYAGYIQRLNRLCVVFAPLIEQIQKDSPATDVSEHTYWIPCRHGTTAYRHVWPKNNWPTNASKKMWYYGTKLHIVGLRVLRLDRRSRRTALRSYPFYMDTSTAIKLVDTLANSRT